MYLLLLGAGLVITTGQDDPELPKGSPAEQVAAIRARLEAARVEYVRKFEKATTTAERDRLMREAPRPEPYADLMLRVAGRHPNDPAALDALLWVVGNTPSGAEDSPNAKAKATIIKGYADSDRLAPFAVALSWSVSAADEDALRRLLARSKVDRVRAAATYALARQLVAQAEMIDLHQVRLEVAPTDEAKRQVRESLDKDFGRETAERLRGRKSKALVDEAEQLLGDLVSNKQYAAAEWPSGRETTRLGELAKRDLEAVRTLRPGNPAPATEGADVAGRKLSLADQRGKVVLLTFGGHWCVACRRMYPLERELSKKHAARPFTVFGVNSDESRELVTKVVEAEKMVWPTIWDGGSTEGPLAKRWNVRGWPLVVLIDHQGVIRYKFSGAPDPVILTPLVDRLVDEADTAGRSKK